MAVAERSGLSFEVKWKPFILDKTLPAGQGKDKITHYNSKFGAARVASMLPSMQRTFAEAGLPDFSFKGRVGNTIDSHRLMALALQQGGPAMQDALVERLFDDYFIQGLPLSDKSVLLKAAAAAKVEGAEALLDDPDELTEEVFSEVETAYDSGVSGVPHFIIGGKAHVSGGQEPSVFLDIFKSIAASPQ